MTMGTGKRNEWTLSLLDIQPNDRVLEIGYGPGVGISQVSLMVEKGEVVGIDPSDAMRKQAKRHNRKAILQGKVRLITGTIEECPDFDRPFDKIFSVNSVQFWPDRIQVLKKLYRWLEMGGMIATTYQPVGKHAPDPDAFTEQLTEELRQAGFIRIRRETKHLKPAPAVCVLAEKLNAVRVSDIGEVDSNSLWDDRACMMHENNRPFVIARGKMNFGGSHRFVPTKASFEMFASYRVYTFPLFSNSISWAKD